jgi:hypothetical protein
MQCPWCIILLLTETMTVLMPRLHMQMAMEKVDAMRAEQEALEEMQ